MPPKPKIPKAHTDAREAYLRSKAGVDLFTSIAKISEGLREIGQWMNNDLPELIFARSLVTDKDFADASGKKAKRQKSENDIKRPPAGYLIFLNSVRAQLVTQHPQTHMKDITTEGAKLWQRMTDEEKKPYNDEANILKEKYRADKAAASRQGTPAVIAEVEEEEEEEEGSEEEEADHPAATTVSQIVKPKATAKKNGKIEAPSALPPAPPKTPVKIKKAPVAPQVAPGSGVQPAVVKKRKAGDAATVAAPEAAQKKAKTKKALAAPALALPGTPKLGIGMAPPPTAQNALPIPGGVNPNGQQPRKKKGPKPIKPAV
ncbi:uncharacterized protein EV422DRAFT_152057 [Fimicolochytrium jonesii]|uniref:uncharacterized protein n=1 Tax=Fimicolochytrium jonesii TaxID=1396493 RepID=UPI0022FE0F63|nr:uncharacterized protein EV422DRAFT_152057 [Fimicolochytrium jonesii]KAI8826077.1 hypothetical protein EV422DRAFT_152057 [Fimicolochytrium jonesii]